jgi:hypothetical protein
MLAGICMLFLPRRYVIVPLLLAIFMVPRGEVLVAGGFHFNPARIAALVGWIRLFKIRLSTGKLIGARWNSIDTAFTVTVLYGAAAFILAWMQIAAVYNQIGIIWSALGIYFLLRSLIKDKEDVYRAIKVLLIVAIINGVEMVYEYRTAQNLFGMFIGGVSSVPSIRDGEIRSQGVFAHAILAGTYAATLIPLSLLIWKNTKSKLLAGVGLISSAMMIYTSSSSTPAIASVSGLLAVCFWPIRTRMRLVRRGFVLFLILAQVFMHAPVWYLIARMDLLGASSGYHRAALIDVFIRHFFDWWLIGTKDAAKWGYEMFDLSNQYVSKGESGGLVAFLFFIALISRGFRQLGKARIAAAGDRTQQWLTWLLGAALFAHLMAFFGISYWDQTEVAWYTLLACISAVTLIGIEQPMSERQFGALDQISETSNPEPTVHEELLAPRVTMN